MTFQKKYATEAERQAAFKDNQKRYRTSSKGVATRRALQATPHHRRQKKASDMKRLYGLRIEGFEWLLQQQGGACAIVGCDRDATEVDHDHGDGSLRGLLCFDCNTSLGKLGDTPVAVQKALQYLESRS